MYQSSKKENYYELKNQMKPVFIENEGFEIDNKGGFRV